MHAQYSYADEFINICRKHKMEEIIPVFKREIEGNKEYKWRRSARDKAKASCALQDDALHAVRRAMRLELLNPQKS